MKNMSDHAEGLRRHGRRSKL